MHFTKLSVFSLLSGAALSAPVWKRDVAGDAAGAFTKAASDVAAPLKSLADHFGAADHADASATITAITPDVQAIADAINGASNTIVDLDYQDATNVQPIVDAATTLYSAVFDGFKPVTDLVDSDDSFATLSIGALSQVGVEISSSMNMAALHTRNNDVIKGLAGTIGDKYDSVLNDFGSSIKATFKLATKKRSVRRDTVSDVTAAVQDTQNKLADQLKTLNADFTAADHSDESATWNAIQKDEQAVEATLNDAALAITKMAKQANADTKAVVDAATAQLTDLFNGLADVTKMVDENSAFSLIAYGSMSSLGAKVSAYIVAVSSRFEDGNVLTSLQTNLAPLDGVYKFLPSVEATLTM